MSAPECCGLCQQGRRICPTPEACRIPHSTGRSDGLEALGAMAAWAAVLTLAVAVVAAALVLATLGAM